MAAQSQLLVAAAKKFGSFLHTSNKLAALVSESFSPFRKLSYEEEEEFEKLKSKLERIRDTLKAAERLAISDCAVALWLTELRDLELKAQDVVDEVEFRLQRAKNLEDFRSELLRSGSVKMKGEISFCSFSPFLSSLSCKMKKIENQYEAIAFDRTALELKANDGVINPEASPVNPTSSLIRGELHGRDHDIEKVIEMIFSDDGDEGRNYSVIPIFGMSGVGKTSLVQHVCNNTRVKSEFGAPIWIQDSRQSDVLQLARQIEQGMGIINQSSDSLDMDSIHKRINEHVKKNKFLLVLDDVWIENRENWDTLMAPLMTRLPGGKVIVTTRNLKVAKMLCHKIYRLNCLSDDDCWSVCKELIETSRPKLDRGMESIGRSITVKCKGLPLAARAIGGVLIDQINEEHWNDVLENDNWFYNNAYSCISPVLKISYDALSVPLKRCFAYCSLFPKDHIFRRDQMVKLWMAQGFIDPSELSVSPSLDHLARKYFDQLVAKCFFQLAPSHATTEGGYKMHDLYHELAQHVAGKECSRTEGYILSSCNGHVRHSSLVPLESHRNNTMKFSSFRGQDLRTFLFVGNMEYKSDGIPFPMQIPDDLFLNMLCLRVLDLSNTETKELSDSIGNLIHLRYLGLENTRIKSLPETIGYLFNLLIMNLSNCHDLVELPKGTKLLSNLQHLDLPVNGKSNILMPRGIGQLTSLKSLKIFIVGMDDHGCQIQELGDLKSLGGELSIMDINHITDVKFAMDAKLRDKNKLQKLTLQWSDADPPKTNPASDVLEMLQPHPNLKELVIKGFSGTRFSSWLGGNYLLKLVILDLKDCANNVELPSLGRLPSLKHLGIFSMPRLTHVDREFCGSVGESSNNNSTSSTNSKGFPKLETLKFRKMDAWEEWVGVSDEDFPCLKYLVLDRCPKLRVLPQINNLSYLRVHFCGQLQNFPDMQSPEFFQKDSRAENLKNGHLDIC